MAEQPTQNPADQMVDEPVIPWERRNKIPYLKAYFGTIRYITSMRNRMDEVIAHPISMRSAKKFRNTIVEFTILSWLITAVLTLVSIVNNRQLGEQEGFIALLMVVGMAVVTYILTMLTTGAIKWFFCPSDFDTEIQDRTIALSYYTCCPLVSSWLSPVLLAAGMAVLPPEHGDYVIWAIGAINLLCFIGWYLLVIDAVHSATGRKMKRTVIAAVGMPIVVFGIPLSLGFLLPAITMWVMLYYSLT